MLDFSTKHNDPAKKLGWTERIGYSCGDLACNLVYESLSVYLLIYYTNVVKLSASVVAAVLAVSKILDGISDIVMGGLIDRTKSKLGKARPWILRFFVPLMISLVLVFSAPASLPDKWKAVWLFVSYNLVMTVFYTIVNIPYASMISLMTAHPEERGILSTTRSVFSTLGKFIVNGSVLFLVQKLGNGDSFDQKGWTWAFVVLGLFSIGFYLFCVYSTKERNSGSAQQSAAAEENRPGPIVSLKALCKNPYWILITVSVFIAHIASGLSLGSTAYYAEYNLGNFGAYSLLANSIQVAQIISLFVLIPLLIKKFGKHITFETGVLFSLCGYLLAGICSKSIPMLAAAGVLRGIGNAATGTMFYGLLADSIDYGKRKTGIYCAGMGTAANSFGIKLGSSVSTLVWSRILTWGGFSATAALPDSAYTAISLTYIWIPAVLTAVLFVIMLFYKLDRINKAEGLAK